MVVGPTASSIGSSTSAVASPAVGVALPWGPAMDRTGTASTGTTASAPGVSTSARTSLLVLSPCGMIHPQTRTAAPEPFSHHPLRDAAWGILVTLFGEFTRHLTPHICAIHG